MFWYVLFAVSFVTFYYVILAPLIPLLKLKIALGDKMLLKFKPIFGYFAALKENLLDPHDFYAIDRARQTSHPQCKVVGSNLGSQPFLIFNDPLSYKAITQNYTNYKKKNVFTDKYLRVVDESLTMSEGQKWKKLRSILGQSLHFESLKSTVPLINAIAAKRFKTLDLSQPFECLKFFHLVTGDTSIITFFGEELPSCEGKEAQAEIVDFTNIMMNLPNISFYHYLKWSIMGQRCWTFFPSQLELQAKAKIDKLLNISSQAVNKRIQIKKDQIAKGQPLASNDFLDLHVNEMVKDSPTITMEETVQSFINLFLAGTDTTAYTVTTALYYLGLIPESQNEIRLEVLETLQGRNEVSFNDMGKLVKLNSFVMETMRLKPPITQFIIREAVTDHMVGDVPVKKGWLVTYNIIEAGVKQESFDNPLEFDPKRFLRKTNKDQTYSFTPFSAGGRNCIGQHLAQIEMKVLVALVLKDYKVSLTTKDIKWNGGFFYGFTPENAIKLEKL